MHASLLGDLGIVLVVAGVTGIAARRLGQPSVLGYLLAGLIVGPYIPVPLFADPHRMEELAEVGVVLVLLAVGLEFRVRRLVELLPVSGITAVVQMSALAWAGYTTGSLLGWPTTASVTLGACLAISSTMVVSAVFRTRTVDADVRGQVFGVLVIQDVAAIVLIAVVTALAAGQSLGPRALGLLLVELLAVVLSMFVVGMLVLPRLVRWVLRELDTEALVVLVVGAGFGFAIAAETFGFSAALGAFVAGMTIAESGREHDVEKAIEPLRAVFSALFFVSVGMAVDPRVAWSTLPLALLLAAIVVVAQLLSVGAASLLAGNSLRRSLISGLALGQIGEFAFILATIAIAGGAAPTELLPALVTVATITAFTTPLLLGRADGIVSMVDRWVPPSANELLSAYQAFVRRARASGDGPSIRVPILAVTLDWVALLLLAAIGISVAPRLTPEWHGPVRLGVAVVAVPFLVGLVRSGRRLARSIRDLARTADTPAPVGQAIELVALLAAVLLAGAPALAFLRPLVRQSWLEVVFVAILGIVVTMMARRAHGTSPEYSSEVARLARGLVTHAGAEPSAEMAAPPALGAFDHVPVTLPDGATAAGQTLAGLDLRSRTGATVLAIRRGDQTHLLPTGHERLDPGDTLALSGSEDAIRRARELLTTDPLPERSG
ncbi:MAG: cation:proton antiporter [Alphaproteobacteria bacterium]|nr:cation:proton antiporter [Alphaproteobacteria bacterium]MCB9695679.1 cation:proton antiporter [Alphaproteobacteria bacterium]